MRDVLEACVRAGPERCAIHEPSVAGVQARIDKLLERLRAAPVSVETESGGQAIVDYGATRQAIFQTLYHPHGIWTRA